MASLSFPPTLEKYPSLQELCFREFYERGAIDSTEETDLIFAPLFSKWEPVSRTLNLTFDPEETTTGKVVEIYRTVMFQADIYGLNSQLHCSLPSIAQKVKEAELDENLCLFFNKVLETDYLENRPALNGNRREDAQTIRDWMRDHSGSLEQITDLYLSDSTFTELPPEIDYFTNLTRVDLKNSRVKCLPETFNPPLLKVLYLQNTSISSLPECFNPPLLNLLNISNTLIPNPPEGFNPPLLERLYLSGAPIGDHWREEIPERFKRAGLRIFTQS